MAYLNFNKNEDITKEMQDVIILELEKLIDIIKCMREKKDSMFLFQNEEEAEDWLKFIRSHKNKEELYSLADEIAKRYIFRYEQFEDFSELDLKRRECINKVGLLLENAICGE